MCHTGLTRMFADKQLCGCECGPAIRHYFSSKEEKECLEHYMDQLKKELSGVEERIEDLRKN